MSKETPGGKSGTCEVCKQYRNACTCPFASKGLNQETGERIDELERQVLYYDSKIDDAIQRRARAAEMLRKIKAGIAIKENGITLKRVNLTTDSPRVRDVRNFTNSLRRWGKLKPFIEWNGSIYASDFGGTLPSQPLCDLRDLGQ